MTDGSRVALLPLSTTIAAALPHLPEALVDSAARAALEPITGRMPAALTRRMYFECRLAQDVSRVDFVCCVDRFGRELLLDPHRSWLPGYPRAHPLWTRIGTLCSRWGDSRWPPGDRIYDLWLEFDADADPGAAAALMPSVFVGLARRPTTPPLELWRGALACLETLAGQTMDPQIAAGGHRAIARLPTGATLSYVGMMFPRSATAIRLCVTPLAGAALLEYLNAIQWPGSIREVATLLRSLPCGAGSALDVTTLLHVDVLAGVQPRIGIEIHLQQRPQVARRIVERDLFGALCDAGLCARSTVDTLEQWSGYAVEQLPHQCWPSVTVRRVSHVKLVFEPGRTPEAKTYLSFFHDFVRRDSPWRTRRAMPPGTPHAVALEAAVI